MWFWRRLLKTWMATVALILQMFAGWFVIEVDISDPTFLEWSTYRSIKVTDRFDGTWTAKLAFCAKCSTMVGPEERKSLPIRFETAYKNNARSINQSILYLLTQTEIHTIITLKLSLYSAAKCWYVPAESLSRRVVKTDYIQTAKHGLIEALPHYVTGILRSFFLICSCESEFFPMMYSF